MCFIHLNLFSTEKNTSTDCFIILFGAYFYSFLYLRTIVFNPVETIPYTYINLK